MQRLLRVWRVGVLGVLVGGCTLACRADGFRQGCGVLDGAGGSMSNGAHRMLIAAHQPWPVGPSASSAHLHHSGFLQAFTLRPGLDVDGDGVADEHDPDNDNDGLSDALELSGGAFDPPSASDPQRADSDGDGAPDGGEADAGTDPADAQSTFQIVGIAVNGGQVAVVWTSRAGYRYTLLGAASPGALASAPQELTAVTAASGTGDWQTGLATGQVGVAVATGFYGVRVDGTAAP
jgi:hypothetical protein